MYNLVVYVLLCAMPSVKLPEYDSSAPQACCIVFTVHVSQLKLKTFIALTAYKFHTQTYELTFLMNNY